jgi:hypothetical protein
VSLWHSLTQIEEAEEGMAGERGRASGSVCGADVLNEGGGGWELDLGRQGCWSWSKEAVRGGDRLDGFIENEFE